MPEKKKFTPRLKSYHLLFLAIILCPILILNSNYVNKKRSENKLNEEAKEKFNKIIFGRRLDEFPEDTEKVCKKGSDDQKEYYKTGDGSKIGIKDGAISSEDRPDYINNLIDIIKSSTSDSGEDIDVKEKLTPYIKHLIPVFFFLGVTILAIPGWVMCCSCCCANCCCCGCLKKKICELPFFIITYACYGIVFIASIYGLSQSNSIFVGLADTECSLLKFVGDVIYGENKETKPKWGGIENINNKLTEASEQFERIKDHTLSELGPKKSSISTVQNTFKDMLVSQSQNIENNKNQYTYTSSDEILDLAYDFGTFDASKNPTKAKTFVFNWTAEYEVAYSTANGIMDGVESNFRSLTGEGGVSDTFDEIQGPINDIKASIDNVKDQISDIIISYSDTIDEYGKLGFKIVFSVLTVFVAAIAAIMLVLCFCSGKKCSSCCLFRCGFRIILHILWNILALLMILTFLIGTIFLLVGTIGGDLVSVVSFIVSSENLSKGEGEIALLGEAADKLTICLNGNGDISEEIGIDDGTRQQLEILKTYKRQLESLIIQFQTMGQRRETFNNYDKKLKEREVYSTLDFGFKKDNSYAYKLKDVLNNANNENNYEELSFHCPASNKVTCESSYTQTSPRKCFDLSDCNSNTIKTRYPSSDVDLNKYMEIIYEIISKQQTANSGNAYSIKSAIDAIDGKYEAFIEAESSGLRFFHGSIAGITDIFDSLVGDEDEFLSFLNCKFMGKNIKVVLKFLEKSLGGHFKTVGICLLLSGFSLAIAIIFTILLMSILKENAGK